MLQLKRTDSNDPDFASLVTQLDRELSERYNELQQTYDQYNKVPDLPTVVIAYQDHVPAGCGCFKAFDDEAAEIKRMYVIPSQRGSGIAAAILDELQRWAGESGYRYTVLETGNRQPEAVRFYQKAGYAVTENYGQYIGMETSICMKRPI